MLNRVLLAALAVAIFLGAGGYTLAGLDDRSLRLAQVSSNVCYASRGINPELAASIPEPTKIHCTRPMRDYEAGRIWRFIFAAAVGATAALLVVGGIDILIRRGRSGP